MKIHYASDLHLNFERGSKHSLNIPSGELLILAGDIFEPNWSTAYGDILNKAFFKEISEKFDTTILIAGNHEYYGGYFVSTIEKIRDYVKEFSNIIVLDNQWIEYNGHLIFGGTFWTDMRHSDPIVCFDSQRNMNDYEYISYSEDRHNPYKEGKTKLRAEDTVRENDWARKKLIEFLSKAESENLRPIIVTHHQLSWECVSPEYRQDVLSHAYANLGLDDLLLETVPKGTIVISGHMHKRDIIEFGNSTIYTNSRGYVGRENTSDFKFGELDV